MAWEVQHPRHPFVPPTFSLLHYGMAIDFNAIEVGTRVSLTPFGNPERSRCTCTVTSVDEILQKVVVCCDQPSPSSGPAEISLDRAWWEEGAYPVAVGTEVFHPYVVSDSLCHCRLKDMWCPTHSLFHCLAFFRTAMEDTDPSGVERPISVEGCEHLVCYCHLHGDATLLYSADCDAWLRKARRLFAPLEIALVVTVAAAFGQDQDEIIVDCMALSGSILCRFSVSASGERARDLFAAVRSRTVQHAALQLVLPDGSAADESRGDDEITSLLGLVAIPESVGAVSRTSISEVCFAPGHSDALPRKLE